MRSLFINCGYIFVVVFLLYVRTGCFSYLFDQLSRPTEIAHRWAEVLLVEFFSQGDAERRDGLQVTPLFDREKTTLAGSQVGFLRFVGISLFSKISSFISDLLWLSDQLNRNLNYWEVHQFPYHDGKKEKKMVFLSTFSFSCLSIVILFVLLVSYNFSHFVVADEKSCR